MAGKRENGMVDGAKPDEICANLVAGFALPVVEFRQLAQSGGFSRIVVFSDWTRFMIRGELRSGGYANLKTTKSMGVRKFGNPAAALVLLRKMGILRAEVEMGEWDLEMASLAMRMRPDVTARRLQRRRAAMAEMVARARGTKAEAATAEGGEVNRLDEYARLVERNIQRQAQLARAADAEERWRTGAK